MQEGHRQRRLMTMRSISAIFASIHSLAKSSAVGENSPPDKRSVYDESYLESARIKEKSKTLLLLGK